jgi:DNA modification methylase
MKFHEGEQVTLYHGNCIEVMKNLPENSVDSIVTDPPYELGFMGKSWDSSGVAFNVEVWKEALRVLKPGGHFIAFSGSRTYHRMAVAIEDAGFEIRDQIMWIYGSGFPKSFNISKGIDKAAGAPVKQGKAFKVAGEYGDRQLRDPEQGQEREEMRHDAITDEAKQWQGWGTALKPAHEPMVLARKPLIGTVAANVLTYGTGGLNIDGARVAGEPVPINKLEEWSGFGQKIEPNYEQTMNTQGRWPANVIHDGSDEVVAGFPQSKGGAYPAKRGQAVNTAFAGGQETEGGFRAMGDDGSAARFFYCAKASKRDRNEGLDGFEEVVAGGMQGRQDGSMGSITMNKNHHPTVKPTDLMRYLIRLVTPPAGTVLDPFMGSGSTGKAAIYENKNFIGIEMTDEYLPIAKARIDFAIREEEEKL